MKDRAGLADDSVVYLRSAGAPVPSRDLAARFLAIPRAAEETSRRLLAPILDGVRGIEHRADAGWVFTGRAPAVAPRAAAARSADDADGAAVPANGITAALETPGSLPGDAASDEPPDLARLDFIALAADGVGPGGSGMPRAVALLPVVGGEALHAECFPAGGLDEDGGWAGDVADEIVPAPARGGALSLSDIEAIAETIGDLPVIAHRVGREVDPLRRAAAAAGIEFRPCVVSAARLGHLIYGLKANHLPQEMAALAGVVSDGPDDCRGRARLMAHLWAALVPALQAHGVETLAGLLEFQETTAPSIDFAPYEFTADELRALPESPGVYRFLDVAGATIYIGKAKNLRSRVGSYFVPSARRTPKGRAILERVRRLEIEMAASELEAILLEADLLLRHRPPLNRQFEVSERPAPYGPRQNLVVVLRDEQEGSCTLHLLRGGRYLRRLPCAEEPDAMGPEWSAIDAVVRDAYFATAADDAGGEMDWFLLNSYLRRHVDAVNVLDVDECADAGDAAGRLRVLVAAARAGAGRVLAR
ncbi:MAG TPA: GIY-YIG nuclease family protein [Candidatus Polarisedimenticolia bacterium]|nr:GIY-YIG nuclease family protein [Candidatus Polarisedimenticolia bacterium]